MGSRTYLSSPSGYGENAHRVIWAHYPLVGRIDAMDIAMSQISVL